jgi:hypothetical protein
MDPIFSKLNYKEGAAVYAIHPPEVFRDLLNTLPENIDVLNDIPVDKPIDFIIVFVTQRAQLDLLAQKITPRLPGDAIFWLAYPKGTSKKYTCDFNRDTSWDIMAPYKMLPVRQISIDEDWSALRFRKEEFIQSAKRKPVAD